MNAAAAETLATIDANIGAFARIFQRPSAEELAQAFVDFELTQVQLNLSSLGHATVPTATQLDTIDLVEIRDAFAKRERRLWGASATYNIAHPDAEQRAVSNAAAVRYVERLDQLGVVAASLCTGTRDPENMWRAHSDNRSEAAWADMRASLELLMGAAERADVLLAIEPEPGNIVADTAAARRLVSELGSDAARIGFILDPANLLTGVDRSDHAAVLTEAFEELGDRTICVHAKDLVPWSESIEGRGVVNYDLVLSLWKSLPKAVPLIIQDAAETELPLIRDRLRHSAVSLAAS